MKTVFPPSCQRLLYLVWSRCVDGLCTVHPLYKSLISRLIAALLTVTPAFVCMTGWGRITWEIQPWLFPRCVRLRNGGVVLPASCSCDNFVQPVPWYLPCLFNACNEAFVSNNPATRIQVTSTVFLYSSQYIITSRNKCRHVGNDIRVRCKYEQQSTGDWYSNHAKTQKTASSTKWTKKKQNTQTLDSHCTTQSTLLPV